MTRKLNMKELNVNDSINIVRNLFNNVRNNHWFLSGPQYTFILHLNNKIATTGTDQQKIDYCRMIHQAHINAVNSQYVSLYANLEIHFRSKCAPLLNHLSSFITENNSTQSLINTASCAKA